VVSSNSMKDLLFFLSSSQLATNFTLKWDDWGSNPGLLHI
jgi:hypothetical protein